MSLGEGQGRIAGEMRSSTFALVHGAWHDASCWDLLAPLLEREGHRVVAPDLPCDDPDAGYEEYARVVLEALDDDSEPPVLVGHSLASDTIPLVARERPVRMLIYLSPRLGGFARPEGVEEPVTYRAPLPVRKDELGRTVWEPEAAVAAMYPRVDPALARSVAARLRPQADTRRRPYPMPAPPPVPAAMIWASDDELFRPEWCRWVARELLGLEAIEVPGGHFQMLERPDELSGVLLDLVAARSQT
jgi:pimeloyl-ACP methyl ester carboxylesterase